MGFGFDRVCSCTDARPPKGFVSGLNAPWRVSVRKKAPPPTSRGGALSPDTKPFGGRASVHERARSKPNPMGPSPQTETEQQHRVVSPAALPCRPAAPPPSPQPPPPHRRLPTAVATAAHPRRPRRPTAVAAPQPLPPPPPPPARPPRTPPTRLDQRRRKSGRGQRSERANQRENKGDAKNRTYSPKSVRTHFRDAGRQAGTNSQRFFAPP